MTDLTSFFISCLLNFCFLFVFPRNLPVSLRAGGSPLIDLVVYASSFAALVECTCLFAHSTVGKRPSESTAGEDVRLPRGYLKAVADAPLQCLTSEASKLRERDIGGGGGERGV